MRHERADAAHLGLEPLDKLQIARKIGCGLERCAHHEAGTHRVSDLAQIGQTAHAVLKRHLGGMPTPVERRACRLVTQQVTFGARLMQTLVALAASLAERQRDRTVGMRRMDARDDATQHVIGEEGVFPTLQNERAKSQIVANVRTFDDLVGGKAIAARRGVRPTDAAVQAVVLAGARHLDEPAGEHLRAVYLPAHGIGATRKLTGRAGRALRDEPLVFAKRKRAGAAQLVDEEREPLIGFTAM